MPDNQNIDDKLKQAELDRIKADIRKSESEKKKIDLETSQLEKPIYKSLNFFKTIIAGVLGGIAILSVFQSVIEPTYKKDIIEKELDIAKGKKRIQLLIDSNEVKKKNIESIKDSILSLKEQNQLTLNLISEAEKKNELYIDSISSIETKLKNRERRIQKQQKRTVEIIKDQLDYLKGLNKKNALHVQSIYFHYDRLLIPEDQKIQLKNIVNFLTTHKDTEKFNLVINGYTFIDGSKAYNIKKSEMRAKKVAKFLIEQGIKAERVLVKGYGEVELNPIITENMDKEIEKELYQLKSVVQIFLTY